MQEVLGLMRCWSTDDLPRMQTMYQNMAEEEFDRYCQQVKDAGLSVSPTKRSMRIEPRGEDHSCGMAYYFQRAMVEGSEEIILQLKARFERQP